MVKSLTCPKIYALILINGRTFRVIPLDYLLNIYNHFYLFQKESIIVHKLKQIQPKKKNRILIQDLTPLIDT